MLEDLDDLLQDLETKQLTESSKDIQWKLRHQINRSQLSLEINDILSVETEEIPKVVSESSEVKTRRKIKCYPVYVAGTDIPVGLATVIAPKTCQALHCRNCDFKVSNFQNFEWVENVDYLFLRINMPTFDKVKEKLKTKDGWVAYACHCVAYSTKDLVSLHSIESLPWFCRGHTD